MFKRLISIAAALCAGFFCYGQYAPGTLSSLAESETASRMREDVEFLSSAMLEGRKAGSEGEDMAAAYVSERFRELGLNLLYPQEGDSFGIKTDSGDTMVSHNVAAIVDGYDKNLKDSYIVIGARLDNLGKHIMRVDSLTSEQIFYGAGGNASGLAVMLELAKRIQTNSILFRRSVIFVAFGSSLISNAGSWYFLNRSFKGTEHIDAMINLDMLGTDPLAFYAYTCSNQDMNNIIGNLEAELLPVRPQLVSKEPCASDHRSFYDSAIPSVFFTSGRYPEYNTTKDTADILDYDMMERQSEYIFNYALALAGGAKPLFNPTEELKARASEEGFAVPYSECDVPPSFLGSYEPSSFLMRWVYTYLRYPQKAVEEGIQGRVLVDFIIDVNGDVKDVKVLRGVHPLLDEEAVRVVSASPRWKPGKFRGKKVRSEISMYVEFRLKRK